MLGVISEDSNHNKIFKPMAGATLGQGVPLGAWCSFEKDVAPSSNWLRAGTTFDSNTYPALALYLGTNKVPSRYDHNRPSDYETMTYTANTDITLQYDGELVITQLTGPQDITRTIYIDNVAITVLRTKVDAFQHITIPFKKGQVLKITDSGLSLFVRYYTHPLFIKATSIASDSDKDSILAQIQAFNTYSTEETLTGKTWIDGKPIYRCVIPFSLQQTIGSSTTLTIGSALPSNIPFSNFDNIANFISGVIYRNNRNTIIPVAVQYNSSTQIQVSASNNYGDTDGIVLEYTKTV